MISYAYSIYDRKTMFYSAPYFAPTDGAAARAFADLANDLNTNIGRHPADYVLYCVGSFMDLKGQIEPLSPIRHIIDAQATIQFRPDTFNQRFQEETPVVRGLVTAGFPKPEDRQNVDISPAFKQGE